MKTILITLLAALAVGAQAQEVFTSRYNEQCKHADVDIRDMNYNNRQAVTLEFCPGWEIPQDKNVCVNMNPNGSHIRCYRTEYLKEEYVIGKMARMCYFQTIAGKLKIMCSEPKLYRDTSAKYYGAKTFEEAAERDKYYGARSFREAGIR